VRAVIEPSCSARASRVVIAGLVGLKYMPACAARHFLRRCAKTTPSLMDRSSRGRLGQNSWLNYGPHGETNRTQRSADTVFAPQKDGDSLMSSITSKIPERHFLHMSNMSTLRLLLILRLRDRAQGS